MAYEYGQSKPARTAMVDALEKESARLAVEEKLYQQLQLQQMRLDRIRAQVHKRIERESPAEKVRQAAVLRYGYQPDECRARLEAATREANTWKGSKR